MREFDHNGMLMAEYQGKLFEKSADLTCSTSVFMRRFIHSDLLKILDINNPAVVSPDPSENLESITRQFGESKYGHVKYSKNALFWIGYMYRYISYTREQSTKFVMKLFNYKQLNNVYYSFHTQSPQWCLNSLLEMNNLNESVFDNNERLKQVMRKNR